jgi:hypothetical protein
MEKVVGEEGVTRVLSMFSDQPAEDRLKMIVDHVTAWKIEKMGYLFDDITMLLLEGPKSV